MRLALRNVVLWIAILLCAAPLVAQSTAPAFVNVSARGAKGSAGAMYLAFYYGGATLGSVLPGYAWQAWGWRGVVSACGISLSVAFLADILFCREPRPEYASWGSE